MAQLINAPVNLLQVNLGTFMIHEKVKIRVSPSQPLVSDFIFLTHNDVYSSAAE
ncbi:hypothetical protein [Pedobacter helvus]|uniref:Uncharacterized protein n=1 Tax=Pedobacter helvus TaxID=2563444 RepID=A0ABW9JHD5_9SPHI|nr:hypothetical protein [Pedobacter ureilyticus]